MELTLEGIQRFLIAKGATDACPSCGQRFWATFGYGEFGAHLGLPWCFDRQPDGTVGIGVAGNCRAVIAIACTNCGFIRLHDQYPIRLWLDAEKSVQEAQGNLNV